MLPRQTGILALRAGIHVLAEKPREVSTAKCREILAAQKSSTAKPTVAYHLHFKNTDQGGGEMKFFSEGILNARIRSRTPRRALCDPHTHWLSKAAAAKQPCQPALIETCLLQYTACG